jgi:hypothetical protein
MQINYQLTESDFLEASLTSIRRQSTLKSLLLWLAVFFTSMTVYFFLQQRKTGDEFHPGFFWPVIILVVIVLVVPLMLKRSVRKYWSANKYFHFSIEARVTQDGIEMSNKVASSKIAWTGVVRYDESKNLFILYPAEGLMLIFPKRSLIGAQMDTFRTFLRERVSKT